jgi:hypothetical protein
MNDGPNDKRALVPAVVAVLVGLVLWAGYVYLAYLNGHATVLRVVNLGKGVMGEALVAGVVIFASASLGSALLAAIHPIAERGLRLTTAVALGAGLLATALFLLGEMGLAKLPAVLVLLLISFAWGIRGLWRDLWAIARGMRPPMVIGVALGALALLMLVAALSPPNEWDELSYHLPLASLTAATGRYPVSAHDFSSFPQVCESLTAIGMILGANPGVGRVLHMLFGWTLAAAVYVGASSLSPGRWQPWLAVAVVVTEPIFVNLSHLAGVDLAVALFAVLGVMHILRDGGAGSMALAGVLGGLACGATYRGIYPAIGLGVAALAAGRARALWALVAGGVVVGCPWYVRNFLVTADPVYPFATSLFHVRAPPTPFTALGWPTPELRDRLFEQASVGIHMSPMSFLRLPWDATILGRSGTGTRFDDNISPFYLAIAPALLFVKVSRIARPTWVWIAFALAVTFVWSLGVQGTRYELPVFCAFGVILPTLLEAIRWGVLARACRCLAAGLLGVLYLSMCIMLIDRADTLFVFGLEGPHHYLTTHHDGPLFGHVFQINRAPPTPGPVLMLGDKRTLYLERPVIPDIFLDNLGVLYRNANGDPDRMAERLRESGIRHILEHTIQMNLTATPEERAAYEEMTKRHTDVADQASYLVWRVVR